MRGWMNSARAHAILPAIPLAALDLEECARLSGWSSRASRKVSSESFCQALLAGAGQSCCSLRSLAYAAGELGGSTVSKQAIHKRAGSKAAEMMSRALAAALGARAGAAGEQDGQRRRVVLQDSVTIALPARLARAFPGSGNGSGEAAAMKIHVSYELLSRRLLGFSVGDARTPDQAGSGSPPHPPRQGELLVRDLGYFCLPAIADLARQGIHALTRHKADAALHDPASGERIDLLALLRSGARAVEREVLAGGEQRLPMRMVAFRLPKAAAQRRRRALRRTARRKGRTPKQLSLQLQDWQVYLTTCKDAALGAEALRELYRQRWAIEILFKAMKSCLGVGAVPPYASEAMARCLALAGLMRVALAHAVTLPCLEARAPRGREISALKLASLLELSQRLGAPADAAFALANMTYHCLYDKRKRPSSRDRLRTILG